MSDNLIIDPGDFLLREEVRELRNKVITLLQERDQLVLVECPGIEARYMMLVGALECQAFREEVEYRRVKRKMELLQALANRRQPIDEAKVDAFLSEEMEEYEQRLDDRYAKLNAIVGETGGERIIIGTEDEIRGLYHQIVRALHPDLHPDLSGQEQELFFWAQTAYENRDLGALQMIADAMGASGDPEDEMTGADLKRERDRLIDTGRKIREDIAWIKEQYPYNMKELINDEEWVRQRRDELQGQIDDFIRIRKTYEERIRDLLASSQL